jgi:hypothetical protein
MTVDPDLVRLLKRLKLGQLAPTLPERLTLARAQQLDYAAFLTLLLADEIQRRDQQALERHLVQAGFEDRVTLDSFDWTSPVQLDRRQLQQVFTLEFLARKEHVVFVGPGRRRQEHAGPMFGFGQRARRSFGALHPCRRALGRVGPSPSGSVLRQGLPSLSGAGACHPG